jgi:hypothetical protein
MLSGRTPLPTSSSSSASRSRTRSKRASCGVVGRPPSVSGVCPLPQEGATGRTPHIASDGSRERKSWRQQDRSAPRWRRAVASLRGHLRVPVPSLRCHLRGATPDGRGGCARAVPGRSPRHHAAPVGLRERDGRRRARAERADGWMLRRGVRLRLS